MPPAVPMLGTRRTGTLDVSRYPRMFPVARSVMPGSCATRANRKIRMAYLPPVRHWYARTMVDTQFRSTPALRWRETLHVCPSGTYRRSSGR